MKLTKTKLRQLFKFKYNNRILTTFQVVVAVALLVAPLFVEFVLVGMTQSPENRLSVRFYLPINFEPINEEEYVSEPWTREAVMALPVPSMEEIEAMFRAWGNFYGASPALLRTIAKCESGFKPKALNRTGKYAGMYQFDERTWVGVRKRMGLDPNPNLRFVAVEAIKTAAKKISEGGANAWPVCSRKFYARS